MTPIRPGAYEVSVRVYKPDGIGPAMNAVTYPASSMGD